PRPETAPAGSRRQPQAASHSSRGPAAVVAVKRIFAAETGNYFLLLGATLFLVILGLVMVLSSSAVESYKASGDFFNGFVRQVIFAALGLPLMLLAARMPATFWKKWAGLFMVVAISLQALVILTPLGTSVGGNRNWITFGTFTAQPSELVKVALVVWLGLTLAKKLPVIDDWRELLLPIVPIVGVAIVLVLVGGDLGTTVILSLIVLGALFFAGVKLRYLAIPVVLGSIIGLVAAFGTSSRRDRMDAFIHGCTSIDQAGGICYQTVQGWWALASGGPLGVGLGNSTAKWSWLPEADNDFIFAIIGEELGLIGAVVVLLLFVVIAISMVRIIRANRDPFARITISAVMVWIIGQAFVNIGVVLGVLPVLGVPLPLISAGGSALITSMAAIGIVLSFARHAPERDSAGRELDA
ncbi:MAG: putative lipid II flippase FtsW, partial [Actinomycetota bacterium]